MFRELSQLFSVLPLWTLVASAAIVVNGCSNIDHDPHHANYERIDPPSSRDSGEIAPEGVFAVEDEAMRETALTDRVPAYTTFYDRYPKTRHLAEVQSAILRRAAATGSIWACNEYLSRWPNGPGSDDARRLLEDLKNSQPKSEVLVRRIAAQDDNKRISTSAQDWLVHAALATHEKNADSSDPRCRAVEALAFCDNPQLNAPLTKVLTEHLPEPRSIRETDDKRMLAFWSAINDADFRVRQMAAVSLGVARIPESLEFLTSAIHDRHPSVRAWAAFALGDLNRKESIGDLVAVLDDSNWYVRSKSAESLSLLGWKPTNDKERIAWLRATRQFAALAKESELGKLILVHDAGDRDPYTRIPARAELAKSDRALAAAIVPPEIRHDPTILVARNPDIAEKNLNIPKIYQLFLAIEDVKWHPRQHQLSNSAAAWDIVDVVCRVREINRRICGSRDLPEYGPLFAAYDDSGRALGYVAVPTEQTSASLVSDWFHECGYKVGGTSHPVVFVVTPDALNSKYLNDLRQGGQRWLNSFRELLEGKWDSPVIISMPYVGFTKPGQGVPSLALGRPEWALPLKAVYSDFSGKVDRLEQMPECVNVLIKPDETVKDIQAANIPFVVTHLKIGQSILRGQLLGLIPDREYGGLGMDPNWK
ncbi:MAG TPA: HEAT repeat domain-containing protein [Tepidisphaeraceae bacterium]